MIVVTFSFRYKVDFFLSSMLILSMRLLSLNSFLLGILRHCWPITGFDVVSPAQPSGGITVHVSCTPHKQQLSVPRYASLTHKNMTGTWHLSIFFARFFFSRCPAGWRRSKRCWLGRMLAAAVIGLLFSLSRMSFFIVKFDLFAFCGSKHAERDVTYR